MPNMSSIALPLVLSVAISVFLLRKFLLRLITPRALPGIPAYPDPSPVLGDIPRMKKMMQKSGGFADVADSCAKDLGPIAQLRIGFFSNIIVLTDYQSIDNMLNRQTAYFDRAKVTIATFCRILPKAQICLRTDDMWRHHRRIIGTAMTSKYLSLTTPRANESVEDLINLWRTKGKLGGTRTWSAEDDMIGATLDAICGMAFGSSWGVTRSFTKQTAALKHVSYGETGDVHFNLKLPNIAESTMAVFGSVNIASANPALEHFFRRLSPSYRRHEARIFTFLMEKLAASRIKAKQLGAGVAAELADNTLDLMVARELRGEDVMPDDEMKDEIFQYLVAGTETSGVTLSWWLKYMTNNPKCQHRLREHLLSRLPQIQDRPPTFEELNAVNTPFLEAVVHETLRLSRTASGFVREVTKDVVILGNRVPKGTLVMVPTVVGYEDRSTPIFAAPESMSSSSSLVSSVDSSDDENVAVHRSESLSSVRGDAPSRKVGFWASGSGLEFNPDRWLDEKGNFDLNAGPSLPFSSGQRGCFGKNLAMLELRLFISQLNQAFFFAPVAENQNSFDFISTVATHPKQSFIRPVPWDTVPGDFASCTF